MKTKETCESVLLDFLKENEGFHKKVHLYAVAEDWSPEMVGRTLRNMANPKDGSTPKAKVDYYKGTRRKIDLAMYAIGDWQQPQIKYQQVEVEGKIIYKEI